MERFVEPKVIDGVVAPSVARYVEELEGVVLDHHHTLCGKTACHFSCSACPTPVQVAALPLTPWTLAFYLAWRDCDICGR